MLAKKWRKKFLRDPETAYDLLVEELSKSENVTDTAQIVKGIRDTARKISDLNTERGKLSRLVGVAKREGSSTSTLIADISQKSTDIDSLKISLDELFGQLDACLIEISSEHSDKELKEPPSVMPGYLDSTLTSEAQGCSEKRSWSIDETVDPLTWDAYVDQHPAATCYHRIGWKTIFKDSLGHDSQYLAVRDENGELGGVLPLVRVSSKLFDAQLVSMPFLNYGGPLCNTEDAQDFLITEASKRIQKLDVRHLEVRETSSRDGMAQRRHKVTMFRNLPETDSAFDRTLSTKVRAQCKQALRVGAQVHIGSSDQLDNFYAVFSRNMRDLGTPVLPKEFFRQILSTFESNSFIATVKMNGKPIAAAFLIGHNNTLEVPWASSLRKYNKHSVNMMLYRTIFKEAISRNYAHFDFGRSSPDSSTFRFKKQWGAEPVQLYWHYSLHNGAAVPEAMDSNVKFKVLRWGWQNSPLWLTNWLGPKISVGMP